MTKLLIKQRGTVSDFKETISVPRQNKPDLLKKTFTFTSVDGQVTYLEVRNAKIDMLEYISEGDDVEVEFQMQGSEKNGKQYNNVLTHSIKPLY